MFCHFVHKNEFQISKLIHTSFEDPIKLQETLINLNDYLPYLKDL